MWGRARRMVKFKQGFTLIELMIVVVIIAILGVIAYPTYQESVRKTNRIDAQADMLEVAQRLQRYKIANFSYMKSVNGAEIPIDLSDIRHPGVLPNIGSPLYNLRLINVGLTSWTLVASPRVGAQMAGDGVICLNHRNQKFWAKAATTCAFSTTSNWDGR